MTENEVQPELKVLELVYDQETMEAMSFLQSSLMSFHPKNVQDSVSAARSNARSNISFVLPIVHGLVSARAKDEVVGALHYAKPKGRNFGMILLLGVNNDFRRRGIGTKLVELAEFELEAMGAQSVRLEPTSTESRMFYNNLGYEPATQEQIRRKRHLMTKSFGVH